MKKTILSIAVIAAAIFAASCQKENLQESTSTEGSASVFTATIETVAGTKTTVERVTSPSVAYKTKWDNGDKISINGTIFTATPASDATKATFTKDSGDDPTETFKAYFPIELCEKVKGLIIALPATYTYADGKYNMPMYAESTTTSLSFKNLCGVLAITVSGADFTSVSSIEVSSDQQMNGAFTATAEGVLSFASKTLEDADKKVTLTFATAKSIASDGSATFYIPVPPAANHTLTIKVTDGSTTKLMVTKKSGGVEVARNMVYPIVFDGQPIASTAKATINSSEVDVNWVQLWAGGPKFAEYNVGVTDGKAESYGGYYAWGGSQDKVDDHNTTNTGSGNLTSTDDTATKLWGANWRMPTADELGKKEGGTYIDGLLGKCTVEWIDGQNKQYNNTTVTGFLCTGKGAYASNSVFLPAAGYCSAGHVSEQGVSGRYWSSTPCNNLKAYDLYFRSDNQYVGDANRYFGYSVRAVLAEED